jgi:3-hydroxyisobutyrate dehydrogenase
MPHPVPVGFLGLGRMGEPMATRLVRAGVPLVVWNRSAAPRERLVAAGAVAGQTPADVLDACPIVITMLATADVLDEVLGRRAGRFAVRVADRTLVSMGTVAPAYARGLRADIHAQGGRLVEAPVSGSRAQAEAGQLVAMVAGDADAVAEVETLLSPMCVTTIPCGEIPGGTETKLAVNTYLIALVTGLAESVHFAERHEIDLARLAAVLDAGPMASTTSRGKIGKLIAGDLSAQAAIRDVHYNSRLILEAAAEVGADLPLLSACGALFAEAEQLGHAGDDMVAVLEAIRQRKTDRGCEASWPR